MSLDAFFEIGVARDLGAHLFTADAIKAFAAKYDPQPFHLDEEAARQSILGGLCASGWHTAATWMRCNIAHSPDAAPWSGPGPRPVFGPSPGFRNLRWPRPVYAGETIRFNRISLAHRAYASRPGWRLLTGRAEGFCGDEPVLQFETAVLVEVRA